MEMSSSRPENLTSSTILKRLNDELIEGRDFANRLLSVLASSDGSKSAEDLLVKIVKSFSNTLSLLNVKECDNNSDSVISQIRAAYLPRLDARKSQDHSRESFRRSPTTPRTKKLDRRVCYDRRRTSTSRSWKRDTPALINDGQAWRKYGQKKILNAKYPRHYFRCTYKHDQGCKATKQIQRIQVNPPMYRTTYFGHHTCRKLHQDPELILDSISPSENSIFISFDGTNLKNKQDHFPFVSSVPSTKQGFKEEIIKYDANLQHNQSLLSDYFVSPDLADRRRHFHPLGACR
ncbi:WRKY DNA-binding transcription factor 70 [Ziziphus jujuba]|uniref:WRKY DNA-binding transcription factor 70 n=1 Tax=Ziziphus jujuba TaxID=326968 RepID=A0A6P4AIG0_ZIZJJ|nr:WRKY DNA-binding transcription factor 70 [Ziziphus jujuba]